MTFRFVSTPVARTATYWAPAGPRAPCSSATEEPTQPPTLALGLRVTGAPLSGGDGGLDLCDVLAAAGVKPLDVV